jgi:hypothetical protein
MTRSWLSLLLLLGCEAPRQGAPARPETERVVISRLGVALSVPPPYAVYQRSRAEDAPWVVDLRPGMRSPRLIILDPAGPEALVAPSSEDPSCPWVGPSQRALGKAGDLRYFTSVGCGGSGGIEAFLVGRWSVGERELSVSCRHQAEPAPDPESCLELLRSARAVPITDAPPRIGPSGSLEDPLMLGLPTPSGQRPGE